MAHEPRRSAPILTALVTLALQSACASSETSPPMDGAAWPGTSPNMPGTEAPANPGNMGTEGTSGGNGTPNAVDMMGGPVGEGVGDVPIAPGENGDPGGNDPGG